MGPVTASAALEHLYYQGAAGIYSSEGRWQSLMLSSGLAWVILVDRRQVAEWLTLKDDFIEEPLNGLSLRGNWWGSCFLTYRNTGVATYYRLINKTEPIRPRMRETMRALIATAVPIWLLDVAPITNTMNDTAAMINSRATLNFPLPYLPQEDLFMQEIGG